MNSALGVTGVCKPKANISTFTNASSGLTFNKTGDTHNVTPRGVRASIVRVEKKKLLHIPRVCL